MSGREVGAPASAPGRDGRAGPDRGTRGPASGSTRAMRRASRRSAMRPLLRDDTRSTSQARPDMSTPAPINSGTNTPTHDGSRIHAKWVAMLSTPRQSRHEAVFTLGRAGRRRGGRGHLRQAVEDERRGQCDLGDEGERAGHKGAVPLPVGQLPEHGDAHAHEGEHGDPASDGAAVHDVAPSRVCRTLTSPVAPSTLTIVPSGYRAMASDAPTTTGTPDSRARIARCDSTLPGLCHQAPQPGQQRRQVGRQRADDQHRGRPARRRRDGRDRCPVRHRPRERPPCAHGWPPARPRHRRRAEEGRERLGRHRRRIGHDDGGGGPDALEHLVELVERQVADIVG